MVLSQEELLDFDTARGFEIVDFIFELYPEKAYVLVTEYIMEYCPESVYAVSEIVDWYIAQDPSAEVDEHELAEDIFLRLEKKGFDALFGLQMLGKELGLFRVSSEDYA